MNLMQKWAPILDHADLTPIKDMQRRKVTAQLLENTELEVRAGREQSMMLSETAIPTNSMGASSSDASTGAIDTFDPILISLVRRSAPNLIAYDFAGVQPMKGPTGLVFALRSRYTNQTGTEAFYNEANTSFSSVVSGANTFGQKHVGTGPTGVVNTYNTGSGMGTAQMEALGTTGNTDFAEMAFSIEKVPVQAKGRALKAEYSLELMQDLKAVHGLDAGSELTNILQGEILAEINRELLRTINITAVPGAQSDTTTAGTFDLDTDSNGRWLAEKFKGLTFQLDREANIIARQTRRGKGNFVICSSDVASALAAAGKLDYTPEMRAQLSIDDTGNTFAGILDGKYKVYIDPYAEAQYFTIGYKGTSEYDAGIFYCPYTPLTILKAQDPNTFTPKIGFKTRYGMVANPFAEGATAGNGALNANSNVYFRRVNVAHIM